jgi:hypothetical protein
MVEKMERENIGMLMDYRIREIGRMEEKIKSGKYFYTDGSYY